MPQAFLPLHRGLKSPLCLPPLGRNTVRVLPAPRLLCINSECWHVHPLLSRTGDGTAWRVHALCFYHTVCVTPVQPGFLPVQRARPNCCATLPCLLKVASPSRLHGAFPSSNVQADSRCRSHVPFAARDMDNTPFQGPHLSHGLWQPVPGPPTPPLSDASAVSTLVTFLCSRLQSRFLLASNLALG